MLLLEPYLTNKEPTEIARPYVKWAYEPARAEGRAGGLDACLRHGRAGTGRPGLLSIPMDDVDKPCARPPVVRTIGRRLGADSLYLAPVIEALSAARLPVLVIGGAVDQSGGWNDAVRLAERLNCKVWAAPVEGRPGFPEDAPALSRDAGKCDRSAMPAA